ncbi:MAG: OsmC family protein [Planctomycetes bacterium]|nr:OsmC family protein [Planctomycetota bacterium]
MGCSAHVGETLRVTFPGGKQVLAKVGEHGVLTDQPASSGGADLGPAPFDLFLASVGTCAGYFVLTFCQSRGLSTEGLAIEQRWERDPASRKVTSIVLEVRLPADFPDKYRTAVLRAADLCSVKRLLAEPPEVKTVLSA